MLGIAANHLPRGSDIPGHGYLIAFDAFLTVLRVSSVIILLNFIFDISTEQRGGEQQAFIQNLPFGANLAGVGFLRFKIGAVGTVTAARLRKGEVVAARRLLGNGIVNIDITVFRQVIQRPAFQFTRLPDLAVSTVVTGEPFATPAGRVMAPRPLPPQAVALSYSV